ncbi:helix-turn-helix domain-containing protein [Flavobacterium sp. '19STA2R22 D10 B1']|uniref:helix-turn-helix domain-containing protein n=1 Tax=Flavobacterium aerium TaxID=3037261 RepID=UPI00278C7771|nr:AraC family transcriptional regulator [Flavobacterium sp. '19STA2R22 D10 B1']
MDVKIPPQMEQPFFIYKFTEESALKAINTPSKPHRHDYEELIIVAEGSPDHFIDLNKETITAPTVIYVAQGKIHHFLPTEATRGWGIRYKTEFIPESKFHFYSNFLDSINYPIQSDECLLKIETLCEIMLDEYKQPIINITMIKKLLEAVLSKLEEEGRKLIIDNPHSSQLITFNNFLKIVEDNYKRTVDVHFYADKLNTSLRNLNLICQNVFNKSVSEIIETRKLIEARQLLLHSDKSISEIGFELGYQEKSYFTRVFTKKTGLTPTQFKAQIQPLFA